MRKGDRVSGKEEEAGGQREGWLHGHPEFAQSLEEQGEDTMKPGPPRSPSSSVLPPVPSVAPTDMTCQPRRVEVIP